MLWKRICAVRKSLQISIRAEEFTTKLSAVQKCLMTYKKLLDSLQNVEAHIKFMILQSYISSLIMLCIRIYQFILIFAMSEEQTKLIANITGMRLVFVSSNLFSTAIICAPCVLVECINSEVNAMMLLITNQLIICRDEAQKSKILDSLNFLEQLRFQFSILGVLNVDATMLWTLVGLCTTYTIAAIQFSHVF